jgi:predicted Fe-Mo cluster-binding NifX family protein
MKIAIASDDQKTIAYHFGRALGFMIYDVQNSKIMSEEYRENIGKSNGTCGSCNHSAMINNIKDCRGCNKFWNGTAYI